MDVDKAWARDQAARIKQRVESKVREEDGAADDRLQRLMQRAMRGAEKSGGATRPVLSSDSDLKQLRATFEDAKMAAAAAFAALRMELKGERSRLTHEKSRNEEATAARYEALYDEYKDHHMHEVELKQEAQQKAMSDLSALHVERLEAAVAERDEAHAADLAAADEASHAALSAVTCKLHREEAASRELRTELDALKRQFDRDRDERASALADARDLHSAELTMALAERDVAHMDAIETLKQVHGEERAAASWAAESRETALLEERTASNRARDDAFVAAAEAQAEAQKNSRLAEARRQQISQLVTEIDALRDSQTSKVETDREAALCAVFAALRATRAASASPPRETSYGNNTEYYDDDDDMSHEEGLLDQYTVDLHHALRIMDDDSSAASQAELQQHFQPAL